MCSNERVASARMFVLIAGHRCHVESERDFRPLTTIAADMGLLAAFLALSMGAWAIAGVQLGAKYDNFVSDGVRLPVLLVGFGVFLLFRGKMLYSRAINGVARGAFAVYLITEYPPSRENLNMIDHLGYGIERMNRSQRDRFLPLPDYDLRTTGEVKLTIYGRVVDEGYTRLLMKESDLPFEEVLALDRIQKSQPIPDAMLRRLRAKGLIEGRKPRLRVAANVATATGTTASYLKQKGESDEYCQALITDYLRRRGRATRAELDSIVSPSLSVELTEEQKRNKVKNLLAQMRREGVIKFERGENKGWSLDNRG